MDKVELFTQGKTLVDKTLAYAAFKVAIATARTNNLFIIFQT